MKPTSTFIVASALFVAGCQQVKKEKSESDTTLPKEAFIQPPLTGVDVQREEYVVDAEKGGMLFYKTGSMLKFPPNSFVDRSGKIVQGDVKILYREFTNPIDFYLSGISMDYDSSGTKYVFESSGMCEILAFKNGEPLFVNQKSKPTIHLNSQTNSTEHSLYYLDTIQRKWIYKGDDVVTELKNGKKQEEETAETFSAELEKPIKPEKANNKGQLIKILIDPTSFKELMVYDNLQFQLEPSETHYRHTDTIEEWNNIELLKAEKGLYRVKFTNSNRSVSYLARPVLEGKDYELALKKFETRTVEYNKRKNERVTAEKTKREQYTRDSLANEIRIEENKRIEQLNVLIVARNKEIEKQNAIVRQQNKIILEENFSDQIVRSFQIDGFGIWNCDKATLLDCQSIIATFKDEKGNVLNLTNVAVLYRSFQGLLRFPNNNLQVVKGGDNMIVGIADGKLAYLSFKEYNKLNIGSDTKERIFPMKIANEKNNTYDLLRKVAEE